MKYINLKEYHQFLHSCYSTFLENLYDNYTVKRFIIPDCLFLSSIGARMCYSDKHPFKMIFNDERIYDNNERLNFLLRLAKSKHFSVFAHSPIFIEKIIFHNTEKYHDYLLISSLFKSFIYISSYDLLLHPVKNIYFCLNFRHYIEALHFVYDNFSQIEDEIKKIYNEKIKEAEKNNLTLIFKNDDLLIKIEINPINLKENIQQIKEINVIPDWFAFHLNIKPFEWFSFIFTNVSRCMTHQLVRHTYQNFNQRSHRYTKVDDNIIIPPSIDKENKTRDKFLIGFGRVLDIYNELINEYNVPKEDARYLISHGINTTIMTSGPRFIFEDFVEKRLHKKAQWEIRNVAKFIKEVLEVTKGEENVF